MSNNEAEKDVENSDEAYDVSKKHGETNFVRECMCSGLDSFIIYRLD